jgi:acyl carrier protein
MAVEDGHMLEDELKQFIIEALRLEDVGPADIDADAPLFTSGLGLDSIDALELRAALRQRYGIELPTDPQASRRAFASVRALALVVAAHTGRAG